MRNAPRQTVSAYADEEGSLAAARFHLPPVSSLHIPRPRLTAALSGADQLPLVVVSAPAGTGKTAAVADWVRAGGAGQASWVTFAEGERPFWTHVLAALRRGGLDVPTSWMGSVGGELGSQRLRTLTQLVVGCPDRLTVIVDGYHMASLGLAREVDYLLLHSLGRIRFVFVGRVDPVLPLYRYRLTDSVLEIRAPDLAFSGEEAVRLMQSAGVRLDHAGVQELTQVVRGWVAGLRFAVRALKDKDDPATSLAELLGQTTDINEYLVGEVLSGAEPETRRLLLDTSVIEAFNAEFAELIGGSAAVRTIHRLANRRAFVEPVPGLPGWYQYYPFFRSFLEAELAHESPERAVSLRRTASRWLRARGDHAQSLALLVSIGAWEELAAQIVDDGLSGRLLLEDEGGALTELAGKLPPEVPSPAASVVRALVALRQGDQQRCSEELASAQRARSEASPPVAVAIAVTDAVRACHTAAPPLALELVVRAEEVLSQMPERQRGPGSSELTRAVAFARGVSALRLGRLKDAGEAFERAARDEDAGLATSFRADCLGYLALTDALRGRLSHAVRHGNASLRMAVQAGLDPATAPPSAPLALAWVALERVDTAGTEEHVALAQASRLLRAQPVCRSLVDVIAATIELSAGRRFAALDRLEAAAASAAENDPWVADLVRAEAARVMVRNGNAEDALHLLGSCADPDLPEVSVLVATARLEQGGSPPVAPPEIDLSEAASRSVRVRALLAQAAHVSAERSPMQAGPALSRALRLAAKERLRRPFLDAGPSLSRVLAAHPRLLGEQGWLDNRERGRSGPEASRPADGAARLRIVVEPLTAKELEVLGHVAELLTTDEIAERMFVSVNTVRTHIRNILRKLGVHRRNAAIRRAQELGLLES